MRKSAASAGEATSIAAAEATSIAAYVTAPVKAAVVGMAIVAVVEPASIKQADAKPVRIKAWIVAVVGIRISIGIWIRVRRGRVLRRSITPTVAIAGSRAAGIFIGLNIMEGLRRVRSRDLHGRLDTEGQFLLGNDYGGLTAGHHYARDSSNKASGCSDARSDTAARRRADECAGPCRHACASDVASHWLGSRSGNELRLNRYLLAVHKSQISELQS
jgi:hypothetical protein